MSVVTLLAAQSRAVLSSLLRGSEHRHFLTHSELLTPLGRQGMFARRFPVCRGQSTARGGARSPRVQPCPGAARAWHSPGGPTGGRAGHLEHPGFYSSPFLRDTRPLRAVWGLCCSPLSSSPPSFPSWHPRENTKPAQSRAGPRALL